MKKYTPNKTQGTVYGELIAFFQKIAVHKEAYLENLRRIVKPITIADDRYKTKIKNGFPLLDKSSLPADYEVMKSYFLNLLSIIGQRVEHEAEKIKAIVSQNNAFEHLIRDVIKGNSLGEDLELLHYLLQETINPLLEVHAVYLAEKMDWNEWHYGYCPVCGEMPLMGVIKGEEGKKYLLCSSCNSQWPFPRVKCFQCGEQDPQQLSYFIVDQDNVYRIETCDTCKTYLKVIDLRSARLGLSADIENLTTLHLDILARKQGYTNRNLFMMAS